MVWKLPGHTTSDQVPQLHPYLPKEALLAEKGVQVCRSSLRSNVFFSHFVCKQWRLGYCIVVFKYTCIGLLRMFLNSQWCVCVKQNDKESTWSFLSVPTREAYAISGRSYSRNDNNSLSPHLHERPSAKKPPHVCAHAHTHMQDL